LAADVSYVGQHAYNQPVGASINAVDFGIAFLPENADPTLTASATPGATARSVDELRSIRGYGNITQVQQVGWRTYHSMQFSLTRRFRNGLSFSVNDTWSLYDHQNTSLRFDHTPDGGIVPRGDQAEADRLLGTAVQVAHLMRANFVWDLPNVSSGGTPVTRVLAALANDWQFAGIWTGRTGAPYSVAYSYQSGGGNINLTGSPDYGARVSLIGDTGSGCSSDIYRQFNTAAFRGPEAGSLGLESSNSYLKGCFSSVLDLSVSRSFRFGGDRTLQFRADLFNAPNAAGITGRNTTMNLSNPLNPRTITNLPFDENGQLIDARSRPRGAGFGVANNYQAARAVQLQIRFSF
jgi:hypothetical protein